MSIPLFQVGDLAYLVESAKVGAIESYQISEVRQLTSGAWVYRISVPSRPPNSTTYGDRITLRRSLDFDLAESELCVYCEAVDLALVAARANLARLLQLKAAHCTEVGGTDGSA